MERTTTRAAVVRALAVCAVVAGITVVVSGTALAAGVTYYASPNGKGSAPCTAKAHSCTLTTALSSEASHSDGADATIVMAKGTYTTGLNDSDLAAGNANVVIKGAGDTTTVIDPASTPSDAVVNFSAADDMTLEDVALEETSLPGTVPVVLLDDGPGASGVLEDSIIADAPNVQYAVVDTDAGSGLDLSRDKIKPQGSLCSKTTTSEKSGSVSSSSWTAPGDLKVKAVPVASCVLESTVEIIYKSGPDAGVETPYTYTLERGSKTVVLTTGNSVPQPAIPIGSTVIWGPGCQATPGKVGGVTCPDNGNGGGVEANGGANVTIDDSTITGASVNFNGAEAAGVLVTAGATATIDDSSVTNYTNLDYEVPADPAAQPGAGIEVVGTSTPSDLLPGTVTLDDVTGAQNDIGILVSGDDGADTNGPQDVTISGSTVSGWAAGIGLVGVVAGAWAGDLNVVVENNTVTGNSLSTGVVLLGSVGETVQSNTIRDNGIGLVIGQCPTPSCAAVVNSATNAITDNTVEDNTYFGVLVAGPVEPPESGGPTTPGQGGNTFSSNSWTANGLADVADFMAGSYVSAGDGLTLAANLPAGTVPTSMSVTTSSATSVLVTAGTVLEVGGKSYGDQTTGGNGAEFYVETNTVVPPGSSPTSIPVSSIAASYDTPFTVVNAGDTISSNKISSATTTNGYTGDSCAPTVNGAAALDTATSNAGFDAC